ncbi:MAG: hypothetical protein HY908_10280 [Myxococcales bacterium]|nr:hypothetical protein [Myxococcales bacterium]
MLDKIASQRELLAEQSLAFIADCPVLYHCHHFNLFLDQTIDDALGGDAGNALRTAAAREAFGELLTRLSARADLTTPPERLELARALFAAAGHGKLDIAMERGGGGATGEHLHYGFTWLDKYGDAVRRRRPADAVAAGYAAAAAELALGLPPRSVAATESACVALRAPRCEFKLVPGQPPEAPRPHVGKAESLAAAGSGFAGLDEARVATIADGLRQVTAGVAGDARGLVQAFGVFVTLHAATYYNRISYEGLKHVEHQSQAGAAVMEALLRESGHVCVFNTFGGILLSPEWEGMVGTLEGGVAEVVVGCCAIARALGFGAWSVVRLEPGRELVLRAPCTYEGPYWRAREERSDRPRCYFFQGAALAIMQLAHRVPWKDRPGLTQEFYRKLFAAGVPWKVEETSCVAKGDAHCEVKVTPV